MASGNMQSMNAVTPAVSSLYAGDLHPDVTEAILYNMFGKYKNVISVRVCRDTATKRSLGYAYVNFSNNQDAAAALEELNYEVLMGRNIRIMWSQRDPALRKSGVANIYIKNLEKSIKQRELYETFAAFGAILSCKIAMRDGKSLGYGFVHYQSEEAAQKAIDSLNGMSINGKAVYVGKFIPRSQRVNAAQQKYTNVFIKNFAQLITTDEELCELFSKFGEITSAKVMKDAEGRSRGFGFVCFKSHDSAATAVSEMDKTKIGEMEVYVGRAMLKEERQKLLKQNFDRSRSEVTRYHQGVNLYIKNLHEEVTDEVLRDAFSKFGEITSVRVMTIAETKRSRGFGFVAFSSPDHATKAVTDMRGTMLLGKPLYVSLAQRKEDRRAHLATQYMQRQRNVAPPANMYASGMPNNMMPMQYYPRQFQGQMMNPVLYQQRPQRWQNPQHAAVQSAQALQASQYMQRQNQHISPGGHPGSAGMYLGPQYSQLQTMRMMAQPRQLMRAPPPTQQAQPSQITAADSGMPSGSAGTSHPIAEGGQHALTKTFQAELTQMSVPAQKQQLGERLHPLIQQYHPQEAGKITGMLLEMDNSELMHLLEEPEALRLRVEKAVAVFSEHKRREKVKESAGEA